MSKNKYNQAIWDKRIKKSTSLLFQDIGSSIDIDKRLFQEDINGSLAHVEMLSKQKIISKKIKNKISKGLKKIEGEIVKNKFFFNKKHEDIHMNIEKRLFQLIGEDSGYIHTGRSRNDQVITDFKIWIRSATKEINKSLDNIIKTILKVSEKNIYTIMPGFTHLKNAQAISFAHYLMAYVEMFNRDKKRFINNLDNLYENPLGVAALSGTSYKIDRFYTTKHLGFKKPTNNSIDTVSDRDFAIDFLYSSAVCAMHLSRLAEDFIILNSDAYQLIEFNDSMLTGSSIMPQKKNPDPAELIRGKMGRFSGNFLNLLTIIKGLPLGYSKDLQEDKEPVFDSYDNFILAIEVTNGIIKGIKVNKNEMLNACSKGNLMATDLADWLVINYNIPFRKAYKMIAKIVGIANKKNCQINDLNTSDLNLIGNNSGKKIKSFLKIESSINYKRSLGSTSPKEVKKAIQNAKKELF